MHLTDTRNRIKTEFENVREVEANGDFFFMYRDEEKFPFATIVTSDNDFDSVSNLNREGFYRLNIGIDKVTFQHLFGSIPARHRRICRFGDRFYGRKQTLSPSFLRKHVLGKYGKSVRGQLWGVEGFFGLCLCEGENEL